MRRVINSGLLAANKGEVRVVVLFVSTLNSLHVLPRAIFLRDSASICPTFASIRVLRASFTTNRSSWFSHMSGTRQARPRRLASNAKVKQEEGGTEDGMSVPQETVEKWQSYAFRPTGKRKDYKSEETSEGKCNCSSILRRQFIGASISGKECLAFWVVPSH